MNETKKEYFWSVVLEPAWIQAGIWTIEKEHVKVLSTSSAVSWGGDENIIEAANAALTEATHDFTPDDDTQDPQKSVFGVAPNWVQDGQIKKEHLGKIREICSKLSLKPSGFVVLPEAIAHAIKLDEGAPFNGIIIGLGHSDLDITVLKLGNLAGTVNVGRSVSIIDDVVEGIARFGHSEHLPSRILLYNGKDAELEEVRQELINADWTGELSDKVKFLHTPKIEIFETKKKVTAVSLAGASEIMPVKGLAPKARPVSEIVEEIGTEHANVTEQESALTPEEVGFVLDSDDEVSDAAITPEPVVIDPVHQQHPAAKPILNKRRPSLSLPKIRFPTLGRGGKLKKFAILGLIIFVVLIVGLFSAWWYLPKAEVAIYIAPQVLEENETITIDEGATSADFDKFVFPAVTKSVSISGEKTRSATGNKTVGDKASGEVEIRNGTAVAVQLDAGTTLTGPNNLQFILDEEASIGSATSPSSPGSERVNVTAEDIGAEYNLAKDESLSISNYPKSELDAVVVDGLSGGSSREIVAVSENDIKAIEEELVKELTSQGNEKIRAGLSVGDEFISEAVSIDIDEADFNHKAGDEAETLKLSLTMNVIGVVLPSDTINQLKEKVLADKVPEGFALKPEQVKVDYELDDEDDGVWYFDTNFEANLLPDIDPVAVANEIAGKNIQSAEDYLSTIAGYKRAEIKVRPAFPGIFARIPRVRKNISIEIVADR